MQDSRGHQEGGKERNRGRYKEVATAMADAHSGNV